MAERSAPTSPLSIDDIDALYKRAGPAERAFMRDLLAAGEPHQGMVFAELLHYFPGARLEPAKQRVGDPLTKVVQEMFPG